MLVRFNTKNFKVSDKTLENIESKLHKRLDRYFGENDDTVFVVRLTDQKKLMEKVELTLPYLGHTLRAEVADSDGIINALDKGVDIMERQIRKIKTKLSRNIREVPEEPVSEDFEAEPDEYSVVKTKTYELKPMGVQEAILNMNMLGHKFYMFKNADDSDVTAVVYKRDDGDYGLLIEK